MILRRIFSLALCMVMVVASACAPKAQSISRGVSVPASGPKVQDIDLKVDGQQEISDLNWGADVTAAVVFRMTENLFAIRDGISGNARSSWAQGILQGVPQTRTKIVDSPYTDLLVQQSADLARDELSKVVPELKASPGKIRALLASLPPPIAPKERVSTEEAVKRTFKFLRNFDRKLTSADLISQLKDGIHQELAKTLALESKAMADIRALNAAKTIRAGLNIVQATTKDLGIDLPASAQPKIEHGRKLGDRIDAIQDAHTALVALIEVWIYLSPEERLQQFKPASNDLYNYLHDMTADDLRCLQDSACANLSKWLARTMVIEPKIKDYGVEKIRALLNEKGAANVRSQVQDAVLIEVRGAAKLIGNQVETKVLEKMAPIVHLQSDFNREVRGRFDQWASKTIESNGFSVMKPKSSRAHLRVGASGRVDLSWSEMPNNTIENVGAFDALAPILWRESGLSVDSVRGLVFAKITSLAKQYENSQGALPADAQSVSARAYAEVIRGLAQLANSFKDWESSPIDSLIGGIKAKDLFPEFSDLPELDRSLFPKAAFYALSFHGLSENLESVQGDRTQVFLIDSNKRITRANEPPSEEQPPAVMAGIADRNGTTLSTTVRAEDVARYLIAMCDVYEATRDVERSTSDILQHADKDGQVPKTRIIQSREKIRLLILALANYLSHQFRAGGELITRELVIATQQPYDLTITVMDQALAIRALVAASNTLGNDLYRWEAADLVSSMNRELYRADLGFYARPDEKTISPVVLLETLRALDEVQPYLPPFSRRQVANITAPWRAKIANWHLQTP